MGLNNFIKKYNLRARKSLKTVEPSVSQDLNEQTVNKQNFQKKSTNDLPEEYAVKTTAPHAACAPSNSVRAKGFFKRNTAKLINISNMKKTNSRFSLANSDKELSTSRNSSLSHSHSIRSNSSRNSSCANGKLSVYTTGADDADLAAPASLQASKSVIVMPTNPTKVDKTGAVHKSITNLTTYSPISNEQADNNTSSLSDIKKTSSVAITGTRKDFGIPCTGMKLKCGSGRSDGNLNIISNGSVNIVDFKNIKNSKKPQTLSPDLQHKQYYVSDVNFNNKSNEKVISDTSLHKISGGSGQPSRQGYPSSGYSSQVSSRHVSNRGSRSKNTSSCSASSSNSLKNKYQLHYSKPETDSINENSIHSQEYPSTGQFNNIRQRRRTKSIDVDKSLGYSEGYEDGDNTSETDMSTTSDNEDNDGKVKHYSSVKQNPKAFQPKQDLRKVISDHPNVQEFNSEMMPADSNQTLIASKTNLNLVEFNKDQNQIKSLHEIGRELNKLQQKNSIGGQNSKTPLQAQISAQLNKQNFSLNRTEAPEPLYNLKASKSITHTDGVGAMMEEFKQKYEVTGIIGRGGGGTVYSGYRRADKLSVAIKQVPKQKIKRWGAIYGFKVPIEFDLLNRVQQRHHSIIEMMDWYERRTSYVMVMERPPHSSDLFEYINRKGAISENNARFIMKQLIEVMIICFKESVFHRDIKDENIMINYHTYEVKLIDFGCGTNLKKTDYTEFAGTPEFYPPEWFNERRYVAEPQTVWSLGVLLWAILYGEVPFQDENAIKDYSGSIIHIKLQSTRVVLSEDALRFLQKALHYDEKRRPSLKYMLKSTWLRKMRKISAHCTEDVQSRLWSVMQNNRNPQFLEHLNTSGIGCNLANPTAISNSLSTSQLPSLAAIKGSNGSVNKLQKGGQMSMRIMRTGHGTGQKMMRPPSVTAGACIGESANYFGRDLSRSSNNVIN